MCILQTKDLCKVYGKGETAVHALSGVNIQVEKGEFVAITGASGSGKSTLLHMLGAVDRPTSGNVIVDGKDVFSMKEKELAVFRRRKIGFIFQFYNLVPVLTAKENITVPLFLDNQKPDEKFLDGIIDELGLRGRENHLPNQLSGGQQQRVAIGRAMIHKPSIILADEPTGNLDTKNSREIMSLLKTSVRKYGQTLVLITHDQSIAAQADRVIVIEDGRVAGGKKHEKSAVTFTAIFKNTEAADYSNRTRDYYVGCARYGNGSAGQQLSGRVPQKRDYQNRLMAF